MHSLLTRWATSMMLKPAGQRYRLVNSEASFFTPVCPIAQCCSLATSLSLLRVHKFAHHRSSNHVGGDNPQAILRQGPESAAKLLPTGHYPRSPLTNPRDAFMMAQTRVQSPPRATLPLSTLRQAGVSHSGNSLVFHGQSPSRVSTSGLHVVSGFVQSGRHLRDERLRVGIQFRVPSTSGHHSHSI